MIEIDKMVKIAWKFTLTCLVNPKFRRFRRLKNIQSSLDKQYDLLRLIVQKMEIRSEAEDQDEGAAPSRYGSPPGIYTAMPGHSGSKLMALRAIKTMKSFGNK